MRTRECPRGIECLVLLTCLGAIFMTVGVVGEGGRRRARESVCVANLSRWGDVFDLYTTEHAGYFYRGWEVGETDLWMNALRPYYGE